MKLYTNSKDEIQYSDFTLFSTHNSKSLSLVLDTDAEVKEIAELVEDATERTLDLAVTDVINRYEYLEDPDYSEIVKMIAGTVKVSDKKVNTGVLIAQARVATFAQVEAARISSSKVIVNVEDKYDIEPK